MSMYKLKHLLLILSIFGICVNAYSQNNVFSECIEYALTQAVSNMDVSNIQDNELKRDSLIYICLDGLPTTDIAIPDTKIIMFSLMNFTGLPSEIKTKLKRGLSVFFVSMTLEQGTLTIWISPKSVSLKQKKHLKIVANHPYKFEFSYSCATHSWQYMKPSTRCL